MCTKVVPWKHMFLAYVQREQEAAQKLGDLVSIDTFKGRPTHTVTAIWQAKDSSYCLGRTDITTESGRSTKLSEKWMC